MGHRRTRPLSRSLTVTVVAVLCASLMAVPASGREGAPVAGVLIERTVTAIVAVHGDGRPPTVSELSGFERRVDPTGRTLSEEGAFAVAPASDLEPVAGGLWEFYDDPGGDHRFRVALFFAVACAGPLACP